MRTVSGLLALLLIVASGLVASTPEAHAQGAYLKIEGIEGESASRDHKDWIDLLSVSQGVQRAESTTGATRRRGAAEFSALTVSKSLDKATPMLLEACASGRALPRVEIAIQKEDGATMTYILSNATVGAVHHATDGRPTEEVAFYYEKVTWSYQPSGRRQKAIETKWDLSGGTG